MSHKSIKGKCLFVSGTKKNIKGTQTDWKLYVCSFTFITWKRTKKNAIHSEMEPKMKNHRIFWSETINIQIFGPNPLRVWKNGEPILSSHCQNILTCFQNTKDHITSNEYFLRIDFRGFLRTYFEDLPVEMWNIF